MNKPDEVQEPDHELESYLSALAPEQDPEGTLTRFGNAEVYQVRLPLLAGDQLRQIAEDRGSAPVALIQEWIMQRLDWENRQGRRY
ncbi:hypothetical protein D5S17_00065 [Pseudonocardiaceae bacterium YIM PH 21723]|nr:hypothetical protein D5S17_00065 [Pseudonocardiaceae bacterium YIM PH 21723]